MLLADRYNSGEST